MLSSSEKTYIKSLRCRDENVEIMCEVTEKDRKRNIFIREQPDIVSIEYKMRENHLRWYKHVLGRSSDVVVRRGEIINISGMRRDRGRTRKTLIETINKD